MRRRLRILFALAAVLGLHGARAADPVDYAVTFKPSGDKALDNLLKQTSALVALQRKLRPAPFALIGRARADDSQFLIVLHSLGYDSGKTVISIGGRPYDDAGLLDALAGAPAGAVVPVVVTPHPGPVYYLGKVDFGALPPGFKPPPTIKPGDVALAAPVLDTTGALRSALHNAGYAFATVSAPLAIADGATDTLDVSFTVDPGPRVDIGPIGFVGLTRTDPDFLRRHIKLRPGQPFSDAALAEARDSLLGLGVFSSVTPVPAAEQAPPGQVPIMFQVAEQKRHAVTLGGAYATDTGITVSASWEDRNLLRNAETLTVSVAASDIGGNARNTSPGYDLKAVFAKPDFYARGQALTLTAEGLKESLTAYSRTAALLNGAVIRPLTPRLTASYGLGFITESVDQEGVTRRYVLVQIPLSLAYDSTDSLLEPTHGARVNLALTPTQSISGSGGRFLIAQISGSTYLPVEHDAWGLLALRALVGSIQGAAQFQVPPDQRFYAGGSGTVRGFTYQTVGPLFPDDNPQGGTAIDAATVEFRQHVTRSIGVVPFIDAGQVSAGGKPFTGTTRVGVGIGARYYTGIGPIRLDIAVPVNKAPGSGGFALYIGLGEAF